MLRAFIVLIILSLSLIIGYAVQSLPMTVRIYDHRYSAYLETPMISWILLSLIAAAALILFAKFLLFLVRSPQIFSRNAKNRKTYQAHRLLEQGLRALATGDYSESEKKLIKGGQLSEQLGMSPILYYENAALAADKQNAADRRDKYFLLARENAVDKDDFLTKITEAETKIENADFINAAKILEQLSKKDARNLKVAMLLDTVYVNLQRWTHAWHNLEKLKKQLPTDIYRQRKKDYAKEMLRDTTAIESYEQLLGAWKSLPTEVREDKEMIVLYAASLVENGHNIEAAKLLSAQIKQNPDIVMVRAYSSLQGINYERSLQNFEEWSKNFKDDAEFHYCRALAAFRAQQYKQAESFIEIAANMKQNAEIYSLWGAILESQDQNKAALVAYRKAADAHLNNEISFANFFNADN